MEITLWPVKGSAAHRLGTAGVVPFADTVVLYMLLNRALWHLL